MITTDNERADNNDSNAQSAIFDVNTIVARTVLPSFLPHVYVSNARTVSFASFSPRILYEIEQCAFTISAYESVLTRAIGLNFLWWLHTCCENCTRIRRW